MAEVAIKNYELYFIQDASLSQTQVENETKKVVNVLEEKLEATNLEVSQEGVKKLAYPIKKSRSGYYTSITFDLAIENGPKIVELEKALNLSERVVRYIIVDETEFLKLKSKEKLNENAEVEHHLDFNKGKVKKGDITNHLGIKAIDYKDVDYLDQFTSPYAKIFKKSRTGSSSKNQRRIKQAIKRARHMALMPFTPLHD